MVSFYVPKQRLHTHNEEYTAQCITLLNSSLYKEPGGNFSIDDYITFKILVENPKDWDKIAHSKFHQNRFNEFVAHRVKSLPRV